MAPNNPLTLHGNEKTMNLNSLILANIQSSPYFKVHLFELKTYHQVIDEIYYKVEHLEPWEKGSRKTAGQTGMCGGVRGVGAGGIVSSAFCLLYKLFTLKLTKKQVIGLLTHADSTYIRALGFMYIRYTQNPADLWDWYVDYLDDEEELDVKAGGGHMMSIGEILKQWLLKLEWYSTLFPRIPVPIQKQNEARLKAWEADQRANRAEPEPEPEPARGGGAGGGYRPENNAPDGFGEAERVSQLRGDSPGRGGSADRRTDGRPADGHRTDARPSPPFNIAQEMDRDRDGHRSHERDTGRRDGKHRDRSRDRERKDRDRHHKRRSRSRDRDHDRHRHKRSRSRDRKRSRSRDRRRSRSRDRKPRRSRERGHDRGHERGHRESSFDRDLRRERDRVKNGR